MQSQTEHLITGPDVAICDRCIEECGQILTMKRAATTEVEAGTVARLIDRSSQEQPGPPPKDQLTTFFREVRGYPSLSHPEREELLARARAGSEEARDELVKKQLETVAVVALAACPPFIQPADAIQEGIVVLTELITDETVSDPLVALATELPTRLARYRSQDGSGR
jgi:DNA-directed RNA polymerase sigma subunit (sigma70/sigma32)